MSNPYGLTPCGENPASVVSDGSQGLYVSLELRRIAVQQMQETVSQNDRSQAWQNEEPAPCGQVGRQREVLVPQKTAHDAGAREKT